jgi:3',5'-cyclic-AMP phosphodiesterase
VHSLVIGILAWVTGSGHPNMSLESVGDDYAVFFKRQAGGVVEAIRVDGLQPNHHYYIHGKHFSTLARPTGKLLSTFVTVNDVHMGESVCGFDSRHPNRGPILHNEPGKIPYAEMMSRNAVSEIALLNPDAVLIKGDLTDAGKPADFKMFMDIWNSFGDKFHFVLGNHDVHSGRPFAAPRMVRIDLTGVILAALDTSIEGKATGQVSAENLEWLEELAKNADRPVMVFGHHHLWNSDHKRDPNYFGINPDDSEKVIALFHKYKCLLGYFSGHTHANKLEYIAGLKGVPFAQTAAIKEFPGAFFEYRVYEGGVEQIMHRITSPESLRWEELTSRMESGTYEHRHNGRLFDRCFTIIPRS